jgi:hypothetical protein
MAPSYILEWWALKFKKKINLSKFIRFIIFEEYITIINETKLNIIKQQ